MAKGYLKLEKEDLLKIIKKLGSRKKYGLICDEEKSYASGFPLKTLRE